jgi:nicotinamidase-related amidase
MIASSTVAGRGGVTTDRAVLMPMDFQEGLCRRDGRLGMSGLAANVEARGGLTKSQQLLVAFREMGRPEIHTRLAFDPTYSLVTSTSARFNRMRDAGMMLAGSPEAQIVAELSPLESEHVVTKYAVNPSVGTTLHNVLAT